MSDDFLSRWSRRKRRAEPEEETVPENAVAPESVPDESDEEILARLGLKHPDEMAPGDDFAAFVRAAVPQHLKSLAYRRLWRSNPTLACLDGLNDYDGDFTGTGVPAGGLKTSYEVGKGILRRIAEVAEDVAPEDPVEPAVEEVETVPALGDDIAAVEEEDAAPVADPAEQPRTRRRMVFRTRT